MARIERMRITGAEVTTVAVPMDGAAMHSNGVMASHAVQHLLQVHTDVGLTGLGVDEARRRVLTDAGYGRYMGGRAGHGLGVEVHEAPFIVQGNSHPLEVGNVFTIEPGV